MLIKHQPNQFSNKNCLCTIPTWNKKSARRKPLVRLRGTGKVIYPNTCFSGKHAGHVSPKKQHNFCRHLQLVLKCGRIVYQFFQEIFCYILLCIFHGNVASKSGQMMVMKGLNKINSNPKFILGDCGHVPREPPPTFPEGKTDTVT